MEESLLPFVVNYSSGSLPCGLQAVCPLLMHMPKTSECRRHSTFLSVDHDNLLPKRKKGDAVGVLAEERSIHPSRQQ